MMIKKIPFLFFVILIFFSACRVSDNSGFQSEFDAIMKEETGEDLLRGLVELDKKYKKELLLKINIAGMYLASDDTENAEAYMNEGLRLIKKCKDQGKRYIFYANMSQLCFKKGDYLKSVEYAKEALEADENDPVGAKITMAKSYADMQENADALKIFKDEWASSKEKFSEEDMVYLLYLLGCEVDSTENISIVVSVADELLIRKPEIVGTGLQQAQVLETSGFFLGSLTASFSELDRLRFLGKMSDKEIFSTLDKFSSHFSPDTPHSRLVQGFRYYMNEEWDKADVIFSSVSPEVPINYYLYLKYAAEANSSRSSKETAEKFKALENKFPLFQGYYYYLWKAMKKNVMFDPGSASDILKKCILSNPMSRFGIESKKELGDLYGIEGGENILLRDELMAYYVRLKNGEPPEILEPVAKFMEMEENIFKADGTAMLKEAEKLPGVAEWLDRRLKRK